MKNFLIFLLQASFIIIATVAIAAEAFLYYKSDIEKKQNFLCEYPADDNPMRQVSYDAKFVCMKGILFIDGQGYYPNPDGTPIKCDYGNDNIYVEE